MSPEIWIALGSNQGDRAEHIRFGLQRLNEIGTVAELSSLYETEPWGVSDQPAFYNLVCAMQPHVESPDVFLQLLQSIESAVGRKPDEPRWGPRPLDLDILFWGEESFAADNLIIPHPRIAQRRFVLEPLAEVAPQFRHPTLGLTIAELLKQCPDRKRIKRVGTLAYGA